MKRSFYQKTALTSLEIMIFEYVVTGAVWLHFLAEVVAGIILLFSPEIFETDADFDMREAMRGFGNGALCIALLAGVILWRSGGFPGRKEKTRTVASEFLLYGLLAQYNIGIFALQIRNPMKNAPVWLAPLFHGSIALIFGTHGALLYMGENNQSLMRSDSGK